MRLSQCIRLLAVVFLTGSLVGFPVLSGEVLARGGGGGGRGGGGGGYHGGDGGGGYHGGDGGHGDFGGGSFRPEPAHPVGPHPGPGPYHPNTPGTNGGGSGWGAYHGGGWGGAAAGAAAGLAVGTVVGALSAGAQPLVVGGQTYYYENDTYYQSCYQGSDSSYCVVQNPNE